MLKLTRTDWDVIEDALRMRMREGIQLSAEQAAHAKAATDKGTRTAHERLSKEFQRIGEEADRVLTKLEESGDI